MTSQVSPSFGVPLTREHCPDWLLRPGRAKCGPLWDTVFEVYEALTGLALPDEMPTTERRSLDAVVEHRDGVWRGLEVDEAQHFNPHRALTPDHYPQGTELAFDRVVWHQRAMASTRLRGGGWGKARPPLFAQEGGRHLQRASRDMLADLSPSTRGWAPTLRIGHVGVERWLDATDAIERMAELLEVTLAQD